MSEGLTLDRGGRLWGGLGSLGFSRGRGGYESEDDYSHHYVFFVMLVSPIIMLYMYNIYIYIYT